MNFKEKINGYTLWMHRIVPTILAGLILWSLTMMMTSIREIRQDFKNMSHNIVYKCDYVADLDRIRNEFDRHDDRIRTLEIKKRR